MATVAGYLRPRTVDEALASLDGPGALVLAGGTRLNAEPTPGPVVLVDLQALELSGIEQLADGVVELGATTTLQAVADSALVPATIRDAARRAEPSTLRAAATIGGCVASGEPSSELLAALLVHDALVCLAGRTGEHTVSLAALLPDLQRLKGRIVMAVTIDTTGTSAAARCGRTRADRPIVAAVVRRTMNGEPRLALAGVAATPVLVTSVDELAPPPGDHLGSSGYRRTLAATLAARALAASSP